MWPSTHQCTIHWVKPFYDLVVGKYQCWAGIKKNYRVSSGYQLSNACEYHVLWYLNRYWTPGWISIVWESTPEIFILFIPFKMVDTQGEIKGWKRVKKGQDIRFHSRLYGVKEKASNQVLNEILNPLQKRDRMIIFASSSRALHNVLHTKIGWTKVKTCRFG